MRVKILVVAILIALFTPVFIVHSTNNDSESFDSQDKKVVEIPESIGYCFPFDGIDLNYFDLVPNLDVAIEVALPILENIYKKSFKEYLNSAALQFNFLFKFLGNKILPRILPCQIFHLP